MRTSLKSWPRRDSISLRVAPSSGAPPPELTTSCTGERSSTSSLTSELTLALPARRCRLSRTLVFIASERPWVAAFSISGSPSSTSRLTDRCGEPATPGSESWECIINLRTEGASWRNESRSLSRSQWLRAQQSGYLWLPKRAIGLDYALSQCVGDSVSPVA